MHIDFVDIVNFRRLRSTRVVFSKDKTVFVDANNSGKTSAMNALRLFLVDRERSKFSLNDFTISNWPMIDTMGEFWESAAAKKVALPAPEWGPVLPFIDLWLAVNDIEIHYVQKLLPSLDWAGGRVGVRLRLEPRDPVKLQKEYVTARANAQVAAGKVTIWPKSLTDFVQRRIVAKFTIKAYVLDPNKCNEPVNGVVQPQSLTDNNTPIDGDPLKGLIRIHEIQAQRELGVESDSNDQDNAEPSRGTGQRLSTQLRQYYRQHLDPYEKPDASDIAALEAIEQAEKAFDQRLTERFSAAIQELEKLGYPGVADPKINIATHLRPIDGLNHDAALHYVVPVASGGSSVDLRLPEYTNGLGYQNLIWMVFRLMRFRDNWMRVGKAQATAESEGALESGSIEPLHLVLIEEPEAHLHTQVQQVFIRQAYEVLRNHRDLKGNPRLTTQLVVSTHSSHVAHECEFASLRYFRRMPAGNEGIPISRVINLSDVFGTEVNTERFVTRYMKVTHCDLLFADAAVMIEGPAERMLIPHFIRHHEEFKRLSECYITWLEVGGSHAHRFKPLIEKLGLTTLIITDLDAVDANGRSVPPRRGSSLKTRNATIQSWCPANENLDELVSTPDATKIRTYADERFAVRVAYQSAIKINFKGSGSEALSNTLEDALAFENIPLFAASDGKGLMRSIQNAIADSATVQELSQKLHDCLKSGGKAELALDLLEIKDSKALNPPSYIRDGLLWLAEQLRQKHAALGLSPSKVEKQDGGGE